MSEPFSIKLVGDTAFAARLSVYEHPDPIMLKGLQAAGRVLSKAVRNAAPGRIRAGVRAGFRAEAGVDPGRLFRSIRSKTLSVRLGPPAVVVGPMARHRHLPIAGTAPHPIHVRSAAAFPRFLGFRTVIDHPGSRPNPWVARGIEAGHSAAMARAADVVLRLATEAGGDG